MKRKKSNGARKSMRYIPAIRLVDKYCFFFDCIITYYIYCMREKALPKIVHGGHT